MSDELGPLREWYDTWGVCVAAVDFESARPLFAKDVVSFGTHATFFVSGIDALQHEIVPGFRRQLSHLFFGQ